MDKEQIRKEWEDGHLIVPAVDIYNLDEQIILKANMPGVQKNKVDVSVADNELMIYGRIEQEPKNGDSYVIREIETGNYYRSFKISEMIDIQKINAKLDDGVLIVTLPKHESAKPHEIPIEVG
jgi:HSP20 family protein